MSRIASDQQAITLLGANITLTVDTLVIKGFPSPYYRKSMSSTAAKSSREFLKQAIQELQITHTEDVYAKVKLSPACLKQYYSPAAWRVHFWYEPQANWLVANITYALKLKEVYTEMIYIAILNDQGNIVELTRTYWQE